MPKDNAKSCDGLQNLRHIAKSRKQQISHNPNGKYCLQGIPEKDNIAGGFAQSPKGIGCSCIAAAVIADINSLEYFAIEIACLKTTENITQCQTDNDFNCHF